MRCGGKEIKNPSIHCGGLNGGSSGYENVRKSKLFARQQHIEIAKSVDVDLWYLCGLSLSIAIIKTLVFVAPLRVASPRLCTRDAALSKFLILTASERNVQLAIAKKVIKAMDVTYSKCISVNFKH